MVKEAAKARQLSTSEFVRYALVGAIEQSITLSVAIFSAITAVRRVILRAIRALRIVIAKRAIAVDVGLLRSSAGRECQSQQKEGGPTNATHENPLFGSYNVAPPLETQHAPSLVNQI